MKVEFIKVNNKNKHLAYKLSVFENQKNHIETAFSCIKEAKIFRCWRPVIIAIDGSYIGFAMYGLWKNEGKYGRVWLDRFFIDKNFQNKGYAHIVLPILLNKIKNTYGYNKLYLSVYKNNKKAIKITNTIGNEFNGV